MRRLLAALGIVLGLAGLVLAAPLPITAQDARSIRWERFDVAVELVPDSTLRVLETEQVRFDGSFQHAFREIPLERLASITEVQVGEPGQPYRSGYNQPQTFAVSRSERRLRIEWWFPPTTNAARSFELRYRVSGRVQVYPDGDQFSWIAVPADLSGPVLASDVTVRLPGNIPVEKAARRLNGRWAAMEPATPSEVRFTTRDLPTGHDFEVRVEFPHGLIAAAPPPWQAAFDRQAWYDSAVRPILNLLLLLLSLFILVGGLLTVFLRWYASGRDPALAPGASEVEVPPSKLPPGLVGTLVDERADVQDVLATLVDLGTRGIIRITEQRDPRLQGSDLDYRLELLQEHPLGLRSYEKTVIGALFGSSREVRLSQVKDRWTANIPLFQEQLYAEAVHEGLFERSPEAVRDSWRRVGLVIVLGGVLVGLLASSVLGGLAELLWLPFAALTVVGLAALVAGGRMPRRTTAGTLEAARWRAFARHLASAGKQSAQGRPEEISRFLPYAVALGVDRSWLENFATVGRPAPRWAPVGNGPIVILGPGGWGFPGPYAPGPWGGDLGGAPQPPSGRGQEPGGGPGGPEAWSGGLSGGLDRASGSLSDLLNAASEALSSGGESGWSGGGGDYGGGGGDSGSAGFD